MFSLLDKGISRMF